MNRQDDLRTARYLVAQARVERQHGDTQRAAETLNLASSIRRIAQKGN